MRSKRGYRVSGRFKDILDVLNSSKKSDQNFLWRSNQRDPLPVHIHEILVQDVHPEENSILISMKDRGLTFKLEDEFYLRLGERDSAFKTRVKAFQKDKVVLEFPDEVALTEQRAEKRHYFHPSDGKTAEIKKIKRVSSVLNEKPLIVTVADISQSGLALIMGESQADHFQLKDRVTVEMLGSYRIKPAVIGEVVFKMPHDTRGVFGGVDQGVKIGVHLDSKLPRATYDRFLVKETLFSIEEKKIIRDLAFRKNVHERMDEMLKQLKKRKNFKGLFEKIEAKTSDAFYIRQHIQLLCECMCGLGTTLGWVSEKTFDKLVYVAYLHDARYFSVPHLARIQTKREFEKMKNSLSFDDKNVFLEGPEYAAELARQDSESYPDAEKILLQQKELPDGNGFPKGIKSPQFTPLSCLFIVSHFFVDYVLNHSQDWSVEDFVNSHQKALRGQYFSKIFDALKGA